MTTTTESPAEKCSAGIASVGVAIAKAYGKQAISGELLDTIVTVCTKIFKGKPANSADQKRVAEDVARIRGWTSASAGPRKSEVKKMVLVYHRFDEAATAYRKTHDNFTWGVAMRLLTCLRKEKTLSKVLALMAAGNQAREIEPMKAIELAVSKLMNLASRKKSVVEFQDALETLCRKQDIDW